MHRGWACCRRRGRSAEVSGVRVTRPSASERDRRDIGGRPGRCGPCRIAYRNDIGSVEGRALGKKGANSARRWEASPSPSVRTRSGPSAKAARRISTPPLLHCVCVSTCTTTMNIVVRFSRFYFMLLLLLPQCRTIDRRKHSLVAP